MIKTTAIAELVEQLPPDIQKEIKDFADFLLLKRLGRNINTGTPNGSP